MKKNGKPYIYTSATINTYNVADDCKLKYFDPTTGYFEAIEYFSSTSAWIMHALISGSVSVGDIITIEDFQITEKKFITPFTPSSRGISKLEFNLNRDINLDWSKDWSIVYFKKPIASCNSIDKTGYNIESLGCNSNSIGGGYTWWGKTINENAIYSSTPSAVFDSTKYFNHWRMVSLVSTNGVITFKEWSPTEGIVYSRTAAAPTISNYYVTQHGYDLMLGGFNDGNYTNSYYRDLIVTQRAFTDDELKVLSNNFISVTKESLCVQNLLTENETM
jgi:hypothetical protein